MIIITIANILQSHALKGHYVECLKDGEYIKPLMNFVFKLLGHSEGKPKSISKFDVTTYEAGSDSTPREELDHLASHLYYLALVHVSSLTKSWWLESSSRLTVQTVESWTAKFISPHMISAVLNNVQEWSANPPASSSDEGNPLVIKTNAQTNELSATYNINSADNDEESHALSILITLPPTFPLHPATVSSLSAKTTFEERRWRGWLRSAQGVITFSNNSIIDGLLAWRRNVVGALQGKTECTICYSLVSEDGKLPNRRCKTCKNSFHLSCLSKWFSSSGEQNCPLCRSDFSGATNIKKNRGDRRGEDVD
jgi:E3 ubiquitin-protein ligase listerin